MSHLKKQDVPVVAAVEGSSRMVIRKLKREEHEKTRRLWETVFAEDTSEFLDYYYSVKTAENEIYVVEEDGEIRAMLQLNPYRLQVGNSAAEGRYIVAVATEEAYRKRGYMAKLLKRAIADMRARGEAFTFLMPAAEAIYKPHGFRFVYRQKQGRVVGKASKNPGLSVAYARKADCGEMARFANAYLKRKYQVYTKRDTHYYERLLEEFRSENGGILLVQENGSCVGLFGFGKEEGYEILEPIFLDGYESEFLHAVYVLTGNETESVHVLGMTDGEHEIEKPAIMAKVLDVSKMLACMEAKDEVHVCLCVTDEPAGESLGRFEIFGEKGHRLRCVEKGRERFGEAERKISIGDLTSILFGYCKPDELGVAEDTAKELGKIEPLCAVFLNEVV